MRFLFFAGFLAFVFCSCSPVSKISLTKNLKKTEERFQDHTGFVLYDLETKKTVFDYKGDHYFTPASNTKIFTLYASLHVLGDSVPALKYIEREDSLIFWGTGDPSFLYKEVFTNNRVYDFLRSNAKTLYFSNANFNTTHFGPGWAWDDYTTNYSPERSSFPIYGNLATITKDSIIPPVFKNVLKGEPKEKEEVVRGVFSNEFVFHPGKKTKGKCWDVPFHIEENTIVELLADTLKRTVFPIERVASPQAKIFYSIPADSLYRVMMQESDNFIAEQLLVMCAGILSDTLQPEIAIKRITEIYLNDLKDKPVWVDGSGLSRYNLFTPRSIVQLWEKIYAMMPQEKLFSLLATGGKTGTIKNWYIADKPYIFGKTGTLSNNHCLSGYLVTKNGKTLIFSFMNGNYITKTNEVRRNMENILKNIYEKY